mgnify:FL=1
MANEALVETSIWELCVEMGRELGEGARRCKEVRMRWADVGGEGRGCLEMLRGVWEEEAWIVEQVAKNVGVAT